MNREDELRKALEKIAGFNRRDCGQLCLMVDGLCAHQIADRALSLPPSPLTEAKEKAVPMVLYCPAGHQHIDEGEWATRPHKTHQCQGIVGCPCNNPECPDRLVCGLEWRPAKFPTVGVAALEAGEA